MMEPITPPTPAPNGTPDIQEPRTLRMIIILQWIIAGAFGVISLGFVVLIAQERNPFLLPLVFYNGGMAVAYAWQAKGLLLRRRKPIRIISWLFGIGITLPVACLLALLIIALGSGYYAIGMLLTALGPALVTILVTYCTLCIISLALLRRPRVRALLEEK